MRAVIRTELGLSTILYTTRPQVTGCDPRTTTIAIALCNRLVLIAAAGYRRVFVITGPLLQSRIIVRPHVGVRVQPEVLLRHPRRRRVRDAVELRHVEPLELEPAEVVRPLPPPPVRVRATQPRLLRPWQAQPPGHPPPQLGAQLAPPAAVADPGRAHRLPAPPARIPP